MATDSGEMIKVDGDVVNNYRWSVSTSNVAREQVPTIEIQEYQQNLASIQQAIQYWGNQADKLINTGKTADPYAQLYSVEASDPDHGGNFYTFPFYSQYHHAIANTWGASKGIGAAMLNTVSNFATEAAGGVFPSATIETAKTWLGTTPQSYTFTFHLLNTVDPLIDIPMNKKLIRALINNNLLDKIDFVSTRPPAICQIKIPGVRGTTVGIMSMISIENVGQINKIDNENVPDAYQISITILELLNESRQIWADELKDGKVFSIVSKGRQTIAKPGKILDNTLKQIDKLTNNISGKN